MIFFDDTEIYAIAERVDMVAALRAAFLNPAYTPARMHETLPGADGATLLIMPCWSDRYRIGVKVATVMPGNAEYGRPTIDGSYILMDGRTGRPIALLSAPALTAVRTACVSALASSLLARQDATTLLMIGTGVLARHLIRAHCAVRPIKRVIVWGRDSRKAFALSRDLADLPLAVEIAEHLPGAIGGADIISSATASHEPLIAGGNVAPGTHVDLVGSFAPDMRESDTALMRRGRLIVDTCVAFAESGDIVIPVREGVLPPHGPDLTRLLRVPDLGRADAGEITVFKSVGTGLADLAVASAIVGHAGLP